MSDHLKLPLMQTLQTSIDVRVQNAMQLLGKSLPCSVVAVTGTIVTVSFNVNLPWTLPQVTIPVVGWQYFRAPIQVGDEGYAVPADVSVGQISGLGSGTASDKLLPANLSALVFMPIGNKNWQSVDGNAATIYGPNGVVLRDTASNTVVTLTPSQITIDRAGTTITINGSSVTVNTSTVTINASSTATIAAPSIDLNGNVTIAGTLSQTGGGTATFSGAITATGQVTGSGIPLSTHVHTGVTTGSSDTGGPIP